MGKTESRVRHTGCTEPGSTKDVEVERIGNPTLCKRGKTHYLYYREEKKSIRRKVSTDLNVARTMASKVGVSLREGSPSPLGFELIMVGKLVESYLEHGRAVQQLSIRTVDRYRAALSHSRRFANERHPSSNADQVSDIMVEDFVE